MAHLAGSPITFAAFLQKPCARRPTEPQKFAGPIWPKPTARPARPDPAPRRGLSATRQHPQDAATPAPCHGRHPSRRSIPVDLWLVYWLLVVALACLPARTHQPMLPYATKSSRRNGCLRPPCGHSDGCESFLKADVSLNSGFPVECWVAAYRPAAAFDHGSAGRPVYLAVAVSRSFKLFPRDPLLTYYVTITSTTKRVACASSSDRGATSAC